MRFEHSKLSKVQILVHPKVHPKWYYESMLFLKSATKNVEKELVIMFVLMK